MRRKVLFLCTGNSAHSQMAEAITTVYWGSEWAAVSAGTQPANALHPAALKALAEIGIDQSEARPKLADQFRGEPFDLVVTVCDSAAQECPAWLGSGKRVHLGFPDPAAAQGTDDQRMDAFRSVRDGLQERLAGLFGNPD